MVTASRRRLLEMSITAGAAVALSGCGKPSPPRLRVADAVLDHDLVVLNGLLEHERRAIAAYTASIPRLLGSDKRTATLFLRQELAHAGRLLALIRRAGGGSGPRSASYQLGEAESPRALLELLHDLERAEVAAYVHAIPQLTPGVLRQSAAAILADDAQHVAVVRAALGLVPTPAAFVTGVEQGE